MRRMTPAKLHALMGKFEDRLYLAEGPIAHLSALTYNLNRDPGFDPNPAPQTARPPAPVKDIDEFRMYRRRGKKPKTLAAKDRRDYTLTGAVADKSGWEAYSKAKVQTKPKHRGKK